MSGEHLRLKLILLDFEIFASAATEPSDDLSCSGVEPPALQQSGAVSFTSHTGGVTVFNISLMEFLLYYTRDRGSHTEVR